LDGIVSRLKSYAPQVEFQHALGLDLVGWRTLTAPENGGVLTCISLEPDMRGDLVDHIKAGERA